MNPDSSIGRILSIDEAIQFFERCIEAEKVMGELSREDKTVILSNFGKDLTMEELTELIQDKRVLRIKGAENA